MHGLAPIMPQQQIEGTSPMESRKAAIPATRPKGFPLPSEHMAADSRQRRANGQARSIEVSPVAPIAPAAKPRQKPKANAIPRPNAITPSASPIPHEGGSDGHSASEIHSGHAVAAICVRLADFQRRRKFCITSQSRADRSIEALIASTIGYRIAATEAERKKTFTEAKRIRVAVERAGDGQFSNETQSVNVIAGLAPLIIASMVGRKVWDEEREKIEKEMIKLARQLPVHAFAASVKGLGDKGLAIIVGESGIPLSEWRTMSGLWKHMGLAVIDGYRQKPKKGERATEEERQKYFDCPARRGQMIGAIATPLLKAQWAAADDEDGNNPATSGKPVAVPAHPTGPYGEIYAKRRAQTEPRIAETAELPMNHADKWTKARCFNDARRVMVKELLADLRTAWRLTAGDGHKDGETHPLVAAATNPAEAGAGGHVMAETHNTSAPGDHWSDGTALSGVPQEALERIAAITAAGGANYAPRPTGAPPHRTLTEATTAP